MKMKRTQVNTDAAPLDPIAALQAAIVAAAEQSWEWHGVSPEERQRLRPGVATLAQTAADQLRAEHAGRQR